MATRAASLWKREPLRVRLVVLFTVLLLVAIAALSTLALTILRSTLLATINEQLDKSAQSLVWELGKSAGNPLIPTDYAVVLADSNGIIVERDSTTGVYPQLGSMSLASVRERGPDPVTLRSEDGDGTWRVTFRAAEGLTGQIEGTAAIALPLDTVNATMRWMGGALMAVGGGIVLAAGLVTYAVVRGSLRPLRRIETTAAQIADGDLSQRIETLPPSTEVGSLGRSLNRMLADLESAFKARRAGEERLQRFVGDASHELRTPLATVRGYTELYRLGGIPDPAVPEVMARIEESATRMSTLVGDLLALTRLDQAVPLAPEAVAVPELLEGLAQDARALDADRLVSVETPADLVVWADSGALRQILMNLVGNAVAYSPPGSPIELVATAGSGSSETGPRENGTGEDDDAESAGAPPLAVIDVCDHGPGIPAPDRERVFERFARLDAGRSRDEGGSGLGLAIAREAARAMSGDVVCLETPGGGTTMRLTLPQPTTV